MTRKKKTGPPPRYTPEEVGEALRSSGGNVSVAAARLGCSRETVYHYVREYEACGEAKAHGKERMLDLAESRLGSAVDKGEAWAICFYLKTQGKQRGYVERQEVTGADGAPVAVTMVEVVRGGGVGDS